MSRVWMSNGDVVSFVLWYKTSGEWMWYQSYFT